MRHRPAPLHRSRTRAGFTLLEVLLAISIATVLVYAIYRAVAMHYLGLELGRETAERAQLARAIADQIRRDLRGTFTAYQPGSGGAVAGATTSGSTTDATGAGTGSTTAYDVPPGGIVGDASSITFVVNMPLRQRDVSLLDYASPTTPLVSGLKMYRYWMATETTPGPNGERGLMRDEYLQVPDATLGITATPAAVHSIAEEVRSLSIRYLSDSEWLSAWDSTMTGPPAAVEVLLEVDPPQAATRGNAVAARTPLLYRVLVAINNGSGPSQGAAGGSSTGTSGSSDSSGGTSGGGNASGTGGGNSSGTGGGGQNASGGGTTPGRSS